MGGLAFIGALDPPVIQRRGKARRDVPPRASVG
ncbi:MAG: hypothetical protein QOF14_1929 [Hyphomicrobiales bacterium]|jgi:hypothetical protein|nr:hypothetical protein [Hyphomicrobiales bacterium]